MWQMEPFEAPGETLREATFDEEGRRTRQDHLEPASGPGVFIPQTLDGFSPVCCLLDLVDDEERAIRIRVVGLEPGRLPLLRDPPGAAQRRFIRGDEPVG